MLKLGNNNFDKLYKLRPFISHLNGKFEKSFITLKNLAVDQSNVKLRGRSVIEQYNYAYEAHKKCKKTITTKPIKFSSIMFVQLLNCF